MLYGSVVKEFSCRRHERNERRFDKEIKTRYPERVNSPLTRENRRRRRRRWLRRRRPVSRRSPLEYNDNPLLQSSWYIKNRNITCLSFLFSSRCPFSRHHTWQRAGLLSAFGFDADTNRAPPPPPSSILFEFDQDALCARTFHGHARWRFVVAIARDADQSTLVKHSSECWSVNDQWKDRVSNDSNMADR